MKKICIVEKEKLDKVISNIEEIKYTLQFLSDNFYLLKDEDEDEVNDYCYQELYNTLQEVYEYYNECIDELDDCEDSIVYSIVETFNKIIDKAEQIIRNLMNGNNDDDNEIHNVVIALSEIEELLNTINKD